MLERLKEFLFVRKHEGINKKISENDLMYKSSGFWYLHFGKAALYRVLKTMEKAGKIEARSILILPCGHGRELRFFKAHFPDAALTACDIDRDAVDFCVETFGVEGIYSEQNPERIRMNGQFDIIWCGSLLTHLDKKYWHAFLRFFSEHLSKNGVFVFSTHGAYITEKFRSGKFHLGIDGAAKRKIFEHYDQTGFGYADYDGQIDYGISLASKSCVFDFIAEVPGLELFEYVERGWFSNHDTVACVKPGNFAKIE